MLATILLAGGLCIALALLGQRAKSSRKRLAVTFLFCTLIPIFLLVPLSQAAGLHWNAHLQVAALTFLGVYLCWKILHASFWGKVGYQSLLVASLCLGGYLYTASQIPYEKKPFGDIAWNQPGLLNTADLSDRWILGLPLVESQPARVETTHPETVPAAAVSEKAGHTRTLRWSELQTLMERDSHIRSVLQNLKKKQERELSEELARLNSISVADTKMRRHALDRGKIENLMRERAISTARFRTILDTWNLLDREERDFRERQREELFHALLELLEDDKVDEFYKVEFIDFMVGRFSNDVRLIQPLIRIYDHLDHEYPRQKRLNKEFLHLYLSKREAVLRGFGKIGRPALLPLLNYRRKTISHMTYSQARMDLFIEKTYGIKVRPLYGVAEPLAIPDFLNRQKYPPLGKLTGASFEEDNIRRGLLKLSRENVVPPAGQPILGLSRQQYNDIIGLFDDGYSERIDALLIDPEPALRANLAWRLAELKNPYTLPLLFELMHDTDPEVRRLAAIALGNFKLLDTQSANDRKFIEILRMLQNYRSNSDAFGRGWAMLALAGIADKQKALYAIDLVLNDGITSNAILGQAAPAWRSQEEMQVVESLVDMLKQTPEELWVKTQALNALIAIDSPESLGVLLNYLHHIYRTRHTRPSMWRYLAPHMSLPQEAENVEDIVVYLARKYGAGSDSVHKQHLKELHTRLWQVYDANLSGEYFQLLKFLQLFDTEEYRDYLAQNPEQIRIMRIAEYFRASSLFWLVFWPVSLLLMLLLSYIVLPAFNLSPQKKTGAPNLRSNPASDTRNQSVAPPSTIVPIKIVGKQ